MSTRNLFLLVGFFLITAMFIRVLVAGLDSNDVIYGSALEHSFTSSLFSSTKQFYIEYIDRSGYLLSFFVFFAVFRLSLLPLDVLAEYRRLTRHHMPELKLKLAPDFAFFAVRIALYIFLFRVFLAGVHLEPELFQTETLMINALVGSLFFVVAGINHLILPPSKQKYVFVLFTPLFLYCLSLIYFSVTLTLLIILTQVINMLVYITINFVCFNKTLRIHSNETYSQSQS